jgi:aminopeptidase-like protein
VPDEWNIRAARLVAPDGSVVCDFADNNLHVVGYSEPVDRMVPFAELDAHLHTLPAMPRAIPYRTSYYRRNWGFCLSHERYLRLPRSGDYWVEIDSSLAPGSLDYAELLVPGHTGREYLVSTYGCHPSLANDNLSGVVLTMLLAREVSRRATRHAYRFVIVPETIGAIAYLAANTEAMRRVAGGFVVTTVAGPGAFGYKESFLGDSDVDRAAARSFAAHGIEPVRYPFDINGSDETQYGSPYFRIPMGTICKDKYYEYPGYHTSLDNLDFVGADHLAASLRLYLEAVATLERNRRYHSAMPYGEPQLGPRGLYPAMGGAQCQPAANNAGHRASRYGLPDAGGMEGRELDAIKWLMFLGDGGHTLLDVAERSGLSMRLLRGTCDTLAANGLLVLEE